MICRCACTDMIGSRTNGICENFEEKLIFCQSGSIWDDEQKHGLFIPMGKKSLTNEI